MHKVVDDGMVWSGYAAHGVGLPRVVGREQVCIMTQGQADMRDEHGDFVWNAAWECTPETYSPAGHSDLDFIENYLEEEGRGEDRVREGENGL